MCGRLTKTKTVQKLDLQEVVDPDYVFADLAPRYNVSPTQPVGTLRIGANGQRELVDLTWGFIPRWLKELDRAIRPINAMSETVAEKPYFRSSFRDRRCAIMADGFYEWKTTADGKQPFYIRLKDHSLFWIAGLWDRWEHNPSLETCVLLTTTPNAICEAIHTRMPVILAKDSLALWLAPKLSREEARIILLPYDEKDMEAYPVSTFVNKPQNQGPTCISPIT